MFIKADVEISFLIFCGSLLLEVLELLSGFLCAVVDRNCSFDFEDFDGLGNSLALVVFSRRLPQCQWELPVVYSLFVPLSYVHIWRVTGLGEGEF